jgi:hypothetical protein
MGRQCRVSHELRRTGGIVIDLGIVVRAPPESRAEASGFLRYLVGGSAEGSCARGEILGGAENPRTRQDPAP